VKINRKNLTIVIAIVIAISTGVGIIFLSAKANDATVTNSFIPADNTTLPAYSISADDVSKPIQQNYLFHPTISSCSQTKVISGSYVQCVIFSSNASGIGNLPSPILKYVIPPPTTYGPGPYWLIVEPTGPRLSQEQMDRVIDVIKNDPEIKSQPFAWKIRDMNFYPVNYSWYDDVRLIIHGIRESSETKGCGWVSTVTIDLNSLTIVKRENTKVVSYDKC